MFCYNFVMFCYYFWKTVARLTQYELKIRIHNISDTIIYACIYILNIYVSRDE